MEQLILSMIGLAIVAKYTELLKKETTSLDDKITVERSIDLLSEATAKCLSDLAKEKEKKSHSKPNGEA